MWPDGGATRSLPDPDRDEFVRSSGLAGSTPLDISARGARSRGREEGQLHFSGLLWPPRGEQERVVSRVMENQTGPSNPLRRDGPTDNYFRCPPGRPYTQSSIIKRVRPTCPRDPALEIRNRADKTSWPMIRCDPQKLEPEPAAAVTDQIFRRRSPTGY